MGVPSANLISLPTLVGQAWGRVSSLSYRSSTNLRVKVLDFVQLGGRNLERLRGVLSALREKLWDLCGELPSSAGDVVPVVECPVAVVRVLA